MFDISIHRAVQENTSLQGIIIGSSKFCGLGTMEMSNIDFIDIIICALDMKHNNLFSQKIHVSNEFVCLFMTVNRGERIYF